MPTPKLSARLELPPSETEPAEGISLSVERGKDGVLVLFIDTADDEPELREDANGPRLRVYINNDDEPAYANPEPPPKDQ
jgi:hypothetical protein